MNMQLDVLVFLCLGVVFGEEDGSTTLPQGKTVQISIFFRDACCNFGALKDLIINITYLKVHTRHNYKLT